MKKFVGLLEEVTKYGEDEFDTVMDFLKTYGLTEGNDTEEFFGLLEIIKSAVCDEETLRHSILAAVILGIHIRDKDYLIPPSSVH